MECMDLWGIVVCSLQEVDIASECLFYCLSFLLKITGFAECGSSPIETLMLGKNYVLIMALIIGLREMKCFNVRIEV